MLELVVSAPSQAADAWIPRVLHHGPARASSLACALGLALSVRCARSPRMWSQSSAKAHRLPSVLGGLHAHALAPALLEVQACLGTQQLLVSVQLELRQSLPPRRAAQARLPPL